MSNLALFIVIIVLVGVGAAWVHLLNKQHAAARERVGKPSIVVDLSMESNHALKTHDEVANGIDGADRVGEKAFDDLTDLKNEDFIYLY